MEKKIHLHLKKIVSYSIRPVDELDGETTPGSVSALKRENKIK